MPGVEQPRILVVDDDPINRMLLARTLGERGHSVTLAEDGRRALELLQADTRAPFDVVLFNECTGEAVDINGELEIRIRTTIDATGGIHGAFHLTPRHVRGVGVESGIAYHAVGGLHDSFNAAADFAPLVFTTTQMFNLVSQGGSDNLQAKFGLHVTVNAQGEVTAEISNFSLACVG